MLGGELQRREEHLGLLPRRAGLAEGASTPQDSSKPAQVYHHRFGHRAHLGDGSDDLWVCVAQSAKVGVHLAGYCLTRRHAAVNVGDDAVKRIDVLFAIEREINGRMPQERVRLRQERSRPLIIELQTWLREQRARLSKNSDTTKAINYSLNRWDAFTRFLDDGRLCMSNNAAERELRAVALGRKNWTFAGSDEGGRRAAAIYTLIATAKLNDIDPQAWLADILARLPDHPAKRIHELLPWNWHPQNVAHAA